MEGSGGAAAATPCYKKKEKGEEKGEDFLASAREHFDQFKNESAERHWICLKNTVRRAKKSTFSFFGSAKVGGESNTGANDSANSPGDPISLRNFSFSKSVVFDDRRIHAQQQKRIGSYL